MRVHEILKAKGDLVRWVRPDAPLALALHELSVHRIGALVVLRDGALEGVLSERDVVAALARHGGRVLELSVADVMSRGGPTCAPHDTLVAVMGEMTRTRNRHLPVVEAGQLKGIISIGDVVKHRLEELELEKAVLRDSWAARR